MALLCVGIHDIKLNWRH